MSREPQVRETVRELLVRARARIANRRNWTQGQFAKSRWLLRQPVMPRSRWATSWCALGALHAETASAQQYGRAYDALWTAAGWEPVEFNDSHTHAEVLAAFDKAIGLAEQELLRADE